MKDACKEVYTMKKILVMICLAVVLLSSCGQAKELFGGITLKKAMWAENTLHEKCVALEFSQKGGYASLDKDGVSCEKVVVGFTILGQRADKDQEWEVVCLMSGNEHEIQANGNTEILLYPQGASIDLPQENMNYCLRMAVQVIYPGAQSLDPNQKESQQTETQDFVIEIQRY